ncbi:unnamed protein product [Rotaria sp. Silwood2]|nr:unnamed protein product [Rotaria sp. Silwood2]
MRTIISTEKVEDIKHLWELVNRIPKAKTKLLDMITDHIYQFGINTIQRISETAIDDPETYVKELINIYKKFLEIFGTESYFEAAFDKACHKFINNNAITQKADTTTKSAELLARYCDELLQKGDETIKEKFNEILIIFNYIEDKDVYEKFYRKMLSKRLVDQLRTDGDDDEKLMISKLKVYNLSIMILTLHFTLFLQQTCGFEYTSRFERMMHDVDVSKNLTNEYQSYCKTNNPKSIVNFSVMVLNSNLWPFSSLPNVILLVELKAILDSFTDFYTHRHNGRKLMWLHQHSKGEIQTYFTKKKYTLQVSTYQMIVLLLFNGNIKLTVEGIRDKTQIRPELLVQVLYSLLESKILLCQEITENFQDHDIQMNHTIELTKNFTSKKIRINLNVPLRSIEQQDLECLNISIDKDRYLVIQVDKN